MISRILPILCVLYMCLTTQLCRAFEVSCVESLAAGLTAEGLGQSWRTANWRGGLIPFRVANSRAVERAVQDADLLAQAIRWKSINESDNLDADFKDTTFRYLIYLADVRIKDGIPVGKIIDGPKRQLEVLTTMLDAYAAGLDTKKTTQIVREFLESYVHRDLGFLSEYRHQAITFFDERIFPAKADLSMALRAGTL